MKRLLLIAAITVPMGLHAQEESQEGFSLMERGMELFFEGLMDEVEPALDGFEALAREFGPAVAEMMEEMGPALADLMDRIDDLSNYEPPVILPNGDIIIKRKPDAPELPEIGQDGAVEL